MTLTTAQIMHRVMLALIPGTLIMTWFFGVGVLWNIVVAAMSAVIVEAVVLIAMRRPVRYTLEDCTAVLTAWLLALALPPLFPWYLTLMGTAVAILLGKQVYGGIGFNPFNPAMVGYAFLLVSFPRDVSLWPDPARLSELDAVLQYLLSPGTIDDTLWDGITRPTPLDQLRNTALMTANTALSAGSEWLWINTGFLVGGVWLLVTRMITWHIPLTILGTLVLLGILDQLTVNSGLNALTLCFTGAAMLGAFFIATDPVSAATSPTGRLIYAAGIGVLIYVIRRWSSWPDGVAFAVLLMNSAAPFIDYYCRPKTT